MEESKDCRSPRSEAVWASRTTTPASSRENTPRGGAGGDAAGGEAVAPPPSVAAPAREQPSEKTMEVVKSKRGHGALSQEAAKARGVSTAELIHRRNQKSRNPWEGLEADADESPAAARRRKPAASAVRKPPPVETAAAPAPAPSKKAAAPKRNGAKKKRQDADEACLSEFNYDRDLRERFFGCLSVVAAAVIWGLPTLAYVAQQPHEFSAARYRDVFPKPSDLEILRPINEGLTIDSMLEWQFGAELSKRCANTLVDVEIYLDRGVVLNGTAGRVAIPAPTRVKGTNDVEPYRLSYDLGNLQMGIHNATVVMRSAATPPKFDPVKNTSLFLTPTLGDPQAPPPGDGGEVAAAGDAESAPAA